MHSDPYRKKVFFPQAGRFESGKGSKAPASFFRFCPDSGPEGGICHFLRNIPAGRGYNEPVTLHIVNRRNALERAMLHFANYEKNTTKIDEDAYECLIYYNQSMETELLIEVLSFGPRSSVRQINFMK